MENLRKLCMNGIVMFMLRESDQLLSVIIISTIFMSVLIVTWPYKVRIFRVYTQHSVGRGC
jgi:hypothetical protein